MAYKDEVLKKLDDGYEEFKLILAGLSDEQMTKVWLDQWSVKDLLAHVAGWHNEMSGGLDRIGRGERPTPEGVDYSNGDSWNAQFAESKKDASPSQVMAELDASFTAFRAAAAAISEERYEPGRTVDRILHANGIDHYIEHGDQIKEWRRTL